MRVPKIALLLAALSIVALAGCSNAGKDQALSTEIKSRMFSDPQVKAASVDVAVKDGEAILSGDVPNDAARYQAYKLAADTPGVKHVEDRMTVETALAPPAPETPVDNAVQAPEPARSTRRRNRASRTESVEREADLNPPPPPPSSVSDPSEPAPQQEADPAPPPPPPPPQPKLVQIPTGTSVRIQMIDGVNSAVNHVGQTFHASLASPIVVDDQIVVPAGTDMYVKLVNAKSAGHLAGQSELALELIRMEFQGKSYALMSNDYQQTGSSRGKRTAETVGGGAVVGALLGAVIGHGKGAAIGAATGAGAGTVAQEATKAQQVQIPSETKLDFLLQQPVDISYFPNRNRSSPDQ